MFIDSRDKEVKHAFALMFVEILLPVAAGANRELNVPALKGFVDMMYHHAFDLTKKTRHSQVSVTAACTMQYHEFNFIVELLCNVQVQSKIYTGYREEAQVRTICKCADENLVRMNIRGFVSERLPLKMQPVVEVLSNCIKFVLLGLVIIII